MKISSKDIQLFKEAFNHLYELAIRKGELYGDTWRTNPLNEGGFGPRVVLTDLSKKIQRLKTLAWDNDPKDNLPRIKETLRDIAVYAVIGMLTCDELMTEKDKTEFESIDKNG